MTVFAFCMMTHNTCSQLVNIGACKTLKHYAFSRKNLCICKSKSIYFDFIMQSAGICMQPPAIPYSPIKTVLGHEN